ncbi:MAG TPA: AzlC family ABC transporter permease [Euzebyales bacterium]|nr:AzlC family ABC transporter permease [Euzebyales bacterium]
MAAHETSAATGWRAGLRVGIGLGAAAFALAVSFGAFAVTHGWPAGLTILMSLVVFSGSAQFALVIAFAGGGLGPALVSASLINLRFVPMAAATSTSLRGSRWRRALEGQAVVDGSWVAAQRPDGSFDRPKLLAATLVQWPAWVAGTTIGALAVPSTDVIEQTALDIVFPGFFLVLLLESLTAAPRRLVPVALAGAAVTGVSCRFLPTGVALMLASGAALLALVWRPSPQGPAFREAPAPEEGAP